VRDKALHACMKVIRGNPCPTQLHYYAISNVFAA